MEQMAVNQREAAQALGVHPHTLRRLIAARRIGVVKVGRRVLVPVAEIERFLEPAESA